MQTKVENSSRTFRARSPTLEFISSTFSPRVALLSTTAANAIAAKSNLTIGQLIAPFSQLQVDASWHEPVNGQVIAPRGLRITPVGIESQKRVDVDSQANRKLLNNTVARNIPSLEDSEILKLSFKRSAINYSWNASGNTPWFTCWREKFLRLHSETQNSHDFLHHFVACIMVMSAGDGQTVEELTDVVGKLSKIQQQHQSEWTSCWAFPSVLKFYLILYDQSTVTRDRADAMYQNLRTTYGGNFCFMIQMAETDTNDSTNNLSIHQDLWAHCTDDELESVTENDVDIAPNPEPEVVIKSDILHPLSPDSEKPPTIIAQNGKVQAATIRTSLSNNRIRGEHLTSDDLKSLQMATNEFISKALLPYIDRQSRLLHESIVNKRGMSKSFFSATKRLFGTTAKTASSVIYANESLEMMSRKLADIYFLFGHYAGAYQLYHQLKKDFLADSAWVYFASSLEMAAVSHFMMSQVEPPLAMARAFPVHYVTDAINYYIDNCRMNDAAMRCALICCECLKQMDNYSEAAAIYIRMTSEDCDLRSALMLEQAAYAFLRVNYSRKYALHCVLAGHRYSKAGLKTHSLKCYLQADQIYFGRGWRYAEDHVHFTIARHQSSLQLTKDISKYLQLLLIMPSPQPSNQIQLFYKEYISTMAKIIGQEPLDFFIPKIMCSDICVRIAVSNLAIGELKQTHVEENDSLNSWDVLEEQTLKECYDSTVILFKPSKMIFNCTSDNAVNPTVPCNETFYVELPIKNPLSIPVSMRNIRLQCDELESTESNIIPEMELLPLETKIVRFGLCAVSMGSVCFDWVHYELEAPPVSVPFRQKLIMEGQRLNSTKAERCGRIYAKDLRNRINIVEKMPLLQASVQALPVNLYHSQATEFQIVLTDKSSLSDQSSRIQEFVIALDNMKDSLQIRSGLSLNPSLSVTSVQGNFTRFKASIDADSTCRIPCILQAPSSGDFIHLKLLLLYFFQGSNTSLKNHRVIKIFIKVPLVNCLKLEFCTLKLLNAASYIGLMRALNLTPDGQIFIERIQYKNNEKFKIEEINISSDVKGCDENGNCIELTPMESRNVILKTLENTSCHLLVDSIWLEVYWKLRKRDGYEATGMSRVLVEDLHRLLSMDENSFIFEVKHRGTGQNDFNINSCLVCDVELLVHARVDGSFTIQLDKNLTPPNVTHDVKASGDEIAFVGQTSWTLHVTALNTYKLKYMVAIMQPGIFNIAPTLSITNVNNSTMNRKYALHSPFIVVQLPSSS